jgi:hypothetical protein
MDEFKQILNWKLKRGSHKFPGPDGGTCINEAAVIAAGYEYRPITSASDMPACFSRPLCQFALRLNDEASDLERQELLPFVTRLACAGPPAIERERSAYISRRNVPGLDFKQRVAILEGALAIGGKADPLGPNEVRTRMDQAKGKALTMDRSVSARVKSWFGASFDHLVADAGHHWATRLDNWQSHPAVTWASVMGLPPCWDREPAAADQAP